ncbi:histidine phosphatase family protein [Rhodococcus sp. D2-41]|uniref:histidine phosphatase family protein n=1 Tax=Speluncibacter jeojiensis TaxID=2710754 RepID=UPI00240FCBB5|nr:histidine phosphatase family protein [Rhodococcus sp. D2-41]MDG3010594.1 histidine phosphatase family protein [Rhodococcus sp. D2-41]
MQLLLIRHALPQRVEQVAGGADPALTELGRLQAQRIPEALAEYDVSAIVSSPMLRARQTAQPLADALGLEVAVDPDLAEYDAGQRNYVPIHEARAAHPEAYARIMAGYIPDFADPVAFTARVTAAMQRLVDDHAHDQTIAVVSHGGVINVYLQQLLDLARPLTFPLEYVSLSRVLISRNGTRKVASVNETGHMRDIPR